jgi:hypothetical protein
LRIQKECNFAANVEQNQSLFVQNAIFPIHPILSGYGPSFAPVSIAADAHTVREPKKLFTNALLDKSYALDTNKQA